MDRNTICFAALLSLLTSGLALAQDSRGSIAGRVLDSTEAVIPEVEVQVTNTETGVTAAAKTNASGSFSIPFLLPGTYRLAAELSGFKRFVRENLQVRVGETVEVNVRMQLGGVTETVEVTAETPLLNTASSSLGQVVDGRRIVDLPMMDGNPMEFALLTPGIITPRTTTGGFKANATNMELTTDGNGSRSNEFQIDGVSNTFAFNGQSRPAFMPPGAAVREFKVQTSNYDASIGHTTGAVMNVATASGTNNLHGEAHWWVRNRAFNAPDFFNNRTGTKPAVYQDNRYGASAGGPVYIPRLYNGRNKTFWYYAWEANKWGTPSTFTGTVPMPEQARGDFSGLLKIPKGNTYQIYDPLTIRAEAGGRFSRQPISNNIIPASRLDPVGLNIVKFFPAPNQPGTVDGQNNFFSALNTASDYYVHLVRFDHAFSQAHRVFLRLHYDWFQNDKDDTFRNGINGILVHHNNRGLALDDVYVLRPSLIFNLRYGITHNEFPQDRRTKGFNLASLGLSPALLGTLDSRLATVPRVQAGAYSRISNWQDGDGTDSSLTHSVAGSFNLLWKEHSLKFGSDFRVYRAFRNRYSRDVSPDFVFPNAYTRGPLDNSPVAPIGQELAAMLLGTPGGGMDRTASSATQDRYWALYLHDDFKVARNLTLNLGLRYELELPVTERFDRLVAGFAAGAANPIEAQAKTNYASKPIPELPAADFRAAGGLTFVQQDGVGRSPFQRQRGSLMPRAGFAWQLAPKTVMRGGYGMFFESIGVNNTAAIQTGFSQTTPIQASLDSGLTYVATNANPFPAGLLPPLGAKGGLATNLGQAVQFYRRDLKHPYAQRWSVGIERLLPGQLLVEATYIGNRGTRLGVDRELNYTPAQYLSTRPVRDQKTIDFLSAEFPSPFFGVNPIYGATISRGALLRPYPEFNSVISRQPAGYSWYHSLQTRAERRLRNGFTLQAAYTFSKLMEATSFLNSSDARLYEGIGDYDRPHRFSMSWIYELPLGRGRRFGSGMPAALNFVVGGWQLGGVAVRQAGAPLPFGNVIFTGDLKRIALPKGERTVDRWFNTEAGFNRNPQEQLGSNIVTFPLRLSGVRTDGTARWDFSLIKNFAIREKTTVQFRAEVYNAWNHPSFAAPNTAPANSNFGRITATTLPGRQWQLSLRLKF